MARTYIRRRYYGTAMDFAEVETEAPKKKKKKGSLLKKAVKLGAGVAAAGAATKYGAKAYAKRQRFRSDAAQSAGLGSKAARIRSGKATKWAEKIGGIGDKQIGQVKKYATDKVTQGRRALAQDKGKFDREQKQAKKERRDRENQRGLEYGKRARKRGQKMLDYSKKKHKGIVAGTKRLFGIGD